MASLVLLFFSVCIIAGLLYWSKDKPAPTAPTKQQIQSKSVIPVLPPMAFDNKIEERAVSDLRSFAQWLADNKAKGFIGEVGWPDRPTDGTHWNKVAEKWYKEASHHDLWVTAWAAGSWWGDYPMALYVQSDGARGLDTARLGAEVLERYPSGSDKLYGVNLAGMEFSTEEGFSNTTRGVAGQDYFYEPAVSMEYLAGRGVRLIRLPIRWERVQPILDAALDPNEIRAITTLLDAAQANKIRVVLDLHNYGTYKTAKGALELGTTLTHAQLSDVWLRLSAAFKRHPALAAYGLMNEPHDLPAGSFGAPARNWEIASQSVLSSLRQAGDTKLIMVAGYDWSGVAGWAQVHPKGWIHDPADSFRYEAHHYWDSDDSGVYALPFSQELSQF